MENVLEEEFANENDSKRSYKLFWRREKSSEGERYKGN